MTQAEPKQQPFSKAYFAEFGLMAKLKFSATDIRVYLAAVRFSESRGGLISVPRAEIAKNAGTTEDQVRKVFRKLCRTEFDWNGFLVPVIDKLQNGRRGRVTQYRANMRLFVLHPAEDPSTFLYGRDSQREDGFFNTDRNEGEVTCF